MGALYILIPIAMVFLAAAAWAFVWAVDHDQFEDLDREGKRILLDDPSTRAIDSLDRPPARADERAVEGRPPS